MAPFGEGDEAIITRIAGRTRESHGPDARLWSEANPNRGLSFVVSGWACVSQQLPSGARQIVEILLPGDLIGFGAQPRLAPACSIVALTPVRTVGAGELATVWSDPQRTPRMAERLEALLAEQHFLLCRHIVRLGRGSAYSRVASLLAELHWRLQGRGLADGASFHMPLTQDQIADTLGLSVVHVNRTIQRLRREQLIVQHKGYMHLPDLEAVHQAGEFTAPYHIAA